MKNLLIFILILFSFYSCNNLKESNNEDVNLNARDNQIEDIVFKDGVVFNYDSLYKYCIEGFIKFKEVKNQDKIVSNEELEYCKCWFNKIASKMSSDEFVQLGRKTKLYSGNDHNQAALVLLEETREIIDDCIYEISIDTMSSSFKNKSYFFEEHDYVKNEMDSWKIKGEFEKIEKYNDRLKTPLSNLKNRFTDQFIDNKLRDYYSNLKAKDFRIGNYRADEEFFPIIFKINSKGLTKEVKLPVPIAEAKSFKKLFLANFFTNSLQNFMFQPLEEVVNVDSMEFHYYNSLYIYEKAEIIQLIENKNNGFFLDIKPVYFNHQIYISEMTFYHITSRISGDFYTYEYYGGVETKKFNWGIDSTYLKDIFYDSSFKSWKYINKKLILQ